MTVTSGATRYRVLRALVVLALVATLATAMSVAGLATTRDAYPFLDARPFEPPVVFYIPTYLPEQGQSRTMKFGGTDFELRVDLASGGVLLIAESTRPDDSPARFIGATHDEAEVRGVLARWRAGRTAGKGHAIHARIGWTLVVISGPISVEELKRIADGLRRASPQSLML